MKRLAINEVTTFRWSFDQDVRNYAATGIEGIGIWRQKLSDFGEEKGIELVRESGLRVSSLLWAGGFTGSDGRTYKESVHDGREAVRLAGALAADCLIIYTGARGGHTHNHARRLIKNALSELAPLAGECGVTLAVEPMHIGCAAEWTFLTNIGETLELLDAIDSPYLKFVFDTYHLGHSAGTLERLPQLVPRIGMVQLGDATQPPNGEQSRVPIGMGIIPIAEMVRSLRGAGYDGFFEVELLGEEIEAADYNLLLAQAMQSLDEMLGPAVT